jgi:hypothetical protein
MPDQIIDAAMVLSLHMDACRASPLVGWVVMRDPPDYPGKVTARLVNRLAHVLPAGGRHHGRAARHLATWPGAIGPPAGCGIR